MGDKHQTPMLLVRELTEGPTKYPRFKVLGGHFYTCNPYSLAQKMISDGDAEKIVVSTEKRKKVLAEFHDDVSAGHFGRKTTLGRVALLLSKKWMHTTKSTCASVRFVSNGWNACLLRK